MRRRSNCRGLTLAIILGLVCQCWLAIAEDAQETANLTVTDEQSSSPSDTELVSVTDQLTRRADENQRSMSFSGDADFEARRPRGLLAALFGYPDEFENNESPAMDSGYGIQEDNNYRGRGGTPPPRFKASHYYTTPKKPTFLSKTTTMPMTSPIPPSTTLRSSAKISEEHSLNEKSNNASDAARNVSSESPRMRTSSNNETDFLDSDVESEEYIGGSSGGDDEVNNATSSTEGSAGNKREVSAGGMASSMRRGRQSQAVQARPLPAGYILWHPVPASFLRGHSEGDGGGSLGSMALSSDMSKQQTHAGRFIPHRPFFVEPNMNGASLNRLPFPPMTSPSDNGANADSLGPREHKAATKLHRQMERERNRERKKKAKKERQKSKDQEQESADDNDEQSDGHDGQNNNNNQQPLHMMLPPLPMNGFPDGPFSTNEQRPFQQHRPLQGPRPLEQHLQRPPPPPPPINFNRDFPAPPPPPPNQGPPRPQRPFMNEHVHQDNVPFPGELNVQRRPPPPDNMAFKNHDNGSPVHFDNRPLPIPFDDNNRPFEQNNNHRVFDSMGPFENHGGHHEGPMRFRERRPSPSPSAHPVKFEIEHHERMREMEEHQFQRGPLGPLPPPPGPHFPPPRFPAPFNDQRPFPDLPPPPPPPPLGSASSRDKHDNNNNNGHHHDRFRDSSSPPTQHLDVQQNFNNLQVPTPDQGAFRGHQPSPPPLPSQLPPFADATAPSAFHSSAADLLPFGHSSQSPSSTPPSAFPSSSTQQPPSADGNFGNGQPQQNFNSFAGPPPLPATFAPHSGLNLNDQLHEQEAEEQEEDNNGFIYSRDFKKSLAEANIVLPNSNQNFGLPKINSRSSSTTLAPSTFGLPPSAPHRPPRPEIMRTSQAVERQQQPFTEHSEKPHPHQVSPAASHRLPQAANNNPHPNLPDFRPTGPTTIRPDMRVDTTTYEPQRDQHVQRSSDAHAPQRSRDNYKSPGFHTGHKGYPSSVTAPNNNNNQVTSSEELGTLYTAVTRASPTVKSNVEVDVQSLSSTTPAAYGYVRHTQSSRNQPSASFSYEIKYQSPAPPSSPVSNRVTNAISSTTFRPDEQSSSSSSSPSASGPFRPRLWPPHRRMRTGGPDSRRPQQPDIV